VVAVHETSTNTRRVVALIRVFVSVFEDGSGAHLWMAKLLYGTGMRLMECLRLRVKDVDFARREILVRDGSRYTPITICVNEWGGNV